MSDDAVANKNTGSRLLPAPSLRHRAWRGCPRNQEPTMKTRKPKASMKETDRKLLSGAPAVLDAARVMKGMDRVLQFLQILAALAGSEDCEPIASPGFAANASLFDQERMDRVFQFLNGKVGEPVRLSEAARIVNLSEGAFSRFFRMHTGKTFPEFVNELRIGRACTLLMEDNLNITEVAYECGFTNLSNFNRQFLRLKGLSPREFRLQLQQRLHQSRFVTLPCRQ